MVDLSQFKTQIIEGINDAPREATAERASNGSDLIHKVNGICDALSVEVASELTVTTYYINFDLDPPENQGDPTQIVFHRFSTFASFLVQKGLTEDLLVIVTGTSKIDDSLDFTDLSSQAEYEIKFSGAFGRPIIDCSFPSYSHLFKTNNADIRLTFENIEFSVRTQLFFEKIKKLLLVNCSIGNANNISGSVSLFRDINKLEFIDCYFYSDLAKAGSSVLNCANINNLFCSNLTINYPSQRSIVLNSSNIYFSNGITFESRNIDTDVDLISAIRTDIYIDRDTKLRNINFFKVLSRIRSANIYSFEEGCFVFKFNNLQNGIIDLLPCCPFDYYITGMYVQSNTAISNFKLLKNNNYLPVNSESVNPKVYNPPRNEDLFLTKTINKLNLEVVESVDQAIVEVFYDKY